MIHVRAAPVVVMVSVSRQEVIAPPTPVSAMDAGKGRSVQQV